MLNFNIENFRNYLNQKDSLILPESLLVEQIGERNSTWIFERRMLKEIQKEDVHNQTLELSYGEDGEREEVVVYWQPNQYVLEPSAHHLPITKLDTLPEKVFKIESSDFIKIIAQANGYSQREPTFPISEGFRFIGTRKFGIKEVSLLLFTGNLNHGLKRIAEQVKIAQSFAPSSSYIVLVFAQEQLPHVSSELNFSISAMRSNLLVSPKAYRERNILVQDVVGVVNYPVIIDHERELVFMIGKRITKQAGTILYKYLRDFILYTQYGPIAYSIFCSQYCDGQNGEASRVIGERKKDIIGALKKVFEVDSPEYNFLLNGLFSYESGFLKSHFNQDDVFEWGE